MELRLDVRKSFWENIAIYHERAKKLKRKIRKLEELIANPPKEEEKKEEKSVEIVKKRKRDWYEHFRWSFTSNGRLVIAGRDARTNETIVRKYLEQNDLFFHADVVGAPSTVLKDGQNASEEEIREAAILAASFSRAWKAGWPSVDVFYVTPDQVSLTPPSGEYRPKGGVMIYGKKNWVRDAPLQLYVSFDEEKNRFFVSPFQPEGPYVLIAPGRTDKTEIAKKILSLFEKDKIHLNDLNALLPPGGSEIREKKLQ
ncbi:MAG: DUF814 domain-containing protein [Candidatus Diapherotrites archaeon]|nr:DUF814 domain-containing protein [Candidatus Diapherotrites archaeon]